MSRQPHFNAEAVYVKLTISNFGSCESKRDSTANSIGAVASFISFGGTLQMLIDYPDAMSGRPAADLSPKQKGVAPCSLSPFTSHYGLSRVLCTSWERIFATSAKTHGLHEIQGSTQVRTDHAFGTCLPMTRRARARSRMDVTS